MIDKNSELEIELRKLGASKALVDNYRGQVEQLEKKVDQQAREFAQLTVQLEEAQAALAEMVTNRDRLRDEVHIYQERIKDLEQGPTARRQVSAIEDVDASLDVELDASGDEGDGASRREWVDPQVPLLTTDSDSVFARLNASSNSRARRPTPTRRLPRSRCSSRRRTRAATGTRTTTSRRTGKCSLRRPSSRLS